MKTVTVWSQRPAWIEKRVDDTCDVVMGQSPPGNTYNAEGVGLPFFQGKAEFGDLYPTPVKWCSAPNKLAEPDDVLISVRAPVGPTNLCPNRSCIGRGLAAIRPKHGMSSRYLLYALRATVATLKEQATGSTFDAVSGSQLRAHVLPVAPLDEQREIVAEIEKQFTRLDAGAAALGRVQANLKRYRAAILKAACEGRLVPTEAELARKAGRSYESGDRLIARVLTERRQKWTGPRQYSEPASPDLTTIPDLPAGWAWARLEQLGFTAGGLTKNPKRARLKRPLPYLRVANVYANELRLDDIEQIGVDESELDKLRLVTGDLLVVEGNGSKGQIGRVAIWDGSIEPCVHQNHLIRFRPVRPALSRWILYWLLSPHGRRIIEIVASSTSGLYTLSVNKVSDLRIAVPPIAEQARIVAEVERQISIVDRLQIVASLNVQRAGCLRQSALQSAFSGSA